jgi:hypothetical protein
MYIQLSERSVALYIGLWQVKHTTSSHILQLVIRAIQCVHQNTSTCFVLCFVLDSAVESAVPPCFKLHDQAASKHNMFGYTAVIVM